MFGHTITHGEQEILEKKKRLKKVKSQDSDE